MSAWIETARGSLVKAPIVAIQQTRGSSEWEVMVNAGPAPALFAPALPDRATAIRIRNAIARHVDRADTSSETICISFVAGENPSVESALIED